jgi:hypothetical protein
MFNEIVVGPQNVGDSFVTKARGGRTGEQIVSQLHGRYAEASMRGNLFMAHAIVTAPVIYSTEAATGGPLLWNGSSTVKASLLAVGVGITVVSTVAAALGITGGGDQTAAPTTTTAIDSTTNMLIGGAASLCTAYRIGTTVENDFFMPFMDVNTGALTTTPGTMRWFNIDGMITVPPNAFASVAASATASTLVVQVALVWEEIPV